MKGAVFPLWKKYDIVSLNSENDTKMVKLARDAVPSPWGASVGLAPPKQSSKPPKLKLKHYKSVEFLSIFNVKPPRTSANPPVDFLATVLERCRYPQIKLTKIQISGDSTGYWALRRQTFRDNCDINIVQQTSCEPLFPDVQTQLKTYFFVPSIRPCMHHNYGVISGSLTDVKNTSGDKQNLLTK